MAVQVVTLPNGDYQIGAEIEGEFVPFAFQSAARVAQYQERARNLRERVEDNDELARDQIGKAVGEDEGNAKPVSKMTRPELAEYADEHEVADFPYDGTVTEMRAAVKEHEAGQGEEA